MKRKTPPLPLESFVAHPKIVGLSTAALGLLTRLVLHYWLTDCAPLPSTDYQLFMLARAHKPTWALAKSDIKAILQDVIPELARSREVWKHRRSVLQKLTDRGVVRIRQKALEKRMVAPVSHIKNDIPRIAERNRAAKIVTPVEAPPRNGFVDKTK